MRRLPPAHESVGQEWRNHKQHDSGGVVLAMRTRLMSLAARCRLPAQVGFAELDQQIEKLRKLRDSYRELSQIP